MEFSEKISPYAEYRKVGLPWVETIPSHWNVERAKWLFQKMNRPIRSEDDVITCFRDGQVTLRKNRRIRGFTESLKEIGYQGIRKGDLVIHAMDAFAGAVGVSDSDGKGSPVYSVIQPRREGIRTHYYARIVHEMSRSQWLAALAKGIRERSSDFRYDDFASQFVPLPPPDEQDGIIKFLSHFDSRITRLIRLKRQQIALLNEQKQAIIQQAVTRGLDPTVRLKPSGVEWLGDIPEHWEVIPLRHLGIKFGSGMTPRGGANVYQSSGIPLIRSQNVHFDGLRLDEIVYISKEIHADMSGTHIKPGDVLLNITGASIGRVCVAPDDIGEANVNQHVSIIRPIINKIKPDYLSAFLSSPFIQNEISGSAEGAAREGLPQKDMKVLPIVVPPIQEQIKIIKWLNISNNRINSATRIAKHEIDLLNEYRTRLIADVVTGKLDVRGVELPEIEIIEDEEIFEEAGDLPEDDLEVEIDGEDGYE